MFQKTSKTLFYMKIIVCKIPPGGGGSGTLSGYWPIGVRYIDSTIPLLPKLQTSANVPVCV